MHATLKNVVAGGLLSVALAAAFYVTADIAVANANPCDSAHPVAPCRWCPGDPAVATGNHVTNPVRWDESVCHNYWFVWFGQGNVAQNIFEGQVPPPPPPPIDPGPFVIDKSNCKQILGMFCPNG